MKYIKINSLPKGWCDKGPLMLHACFQLLVDYVEKEECFEVVDWTCTSKHKQMGKELQRLYFWWKEERPNRKTFVSQLKAKQTTKNILSPLNTRERYPEWHEAMEKDWVLSKKWDKEDTDNLLSLIKIRDFMWT